MKYTVDLSGVRDREGLHERLRASMDLPDWYGNNLDALYDILTDIHRPTQMTILPPQSMNDRMAAYWPRLLRVLTDAAEDCPVFSFEIQ